MRNTGKKREGGQVGRISSIKEKAKGSHLVGEVRCQIRHPRSDIELTNCNMLDTSLSIFVSIVFSIGLGID